jgi:general stress protein 26
MKTLKERILAKIKQPTLAALATMTEDGKPWVRYVIPVADKNLNLWMATFAGARKVGQIRKNPEVHLTVGVTDLESAETYVQIQGRAEILTDLKTKKAVWNDHIEDIFSGPDDPTYVVIKITPYRIEYQKVMPGANPQVWKAK